jgi:putative ubiquitin-RnfH superfamily antitoxin RatB of RatAB toxin-antitoxin module
MHPIEVSIATTQSQQVVALSVPADSTIEQAIILSDIAQGFPELDWSQLGSNQLAVGIFGQKQSMEYIVQTGDRVEIYLPLQKSALDARKQRIADKKFASQK